MESHSFRKSGKLNILQVIAPLEIGGAESVVRTLNQLVNPKYFHVMNCLYVNPARKANPFFQQLQQLNYPTEIVPMLGASPFALLKNITGLLRIISQHQIDLIHTHGYRSDAVGLIAAKLAKKPIISTVHGWTSATKKVRFYEACQKKLLRYFHTVIPVSRNISEELEHHGVRSSRLQVLHNIFIPPASPFSCPSIAELRLQYAIPEKSQVIGVIGRISPEKGQKHLLDAFQLLQKDSAQNDLKLLIVGEGEARHSLEKYVQKQGLADAVAFTGFQNPLAPFFALIDILVIPSTTEGIPLVLLEGMSCQKALVASNVGGIPEIITHRQNGLLAEAGNPRDLAEQILRLLNNPDQVKRLGRNAYSHFYESCDSEKWIQAIESLYEQVMTGS